MPNSISGFFMTLDIQTPAKKAFGPQKSTFKSPNLRRYDWMSKLNTSVFCRSTTSLVGKIAVDPGEFSKKNAGIPPGPLNVWVVLAVIRRCVWWLAGLELGCQRASQGIVGCEVVVAFFSQIRHVVCCICCEKSFSWYFSLKLIQTLKFWKLKR